MGNGRGEGGNSWEMRKRFLGGLNIEELSFKLNPFVIVCLDC